MTEETEQMAKRNCIWISMLKNFIFGHHEPYKRGRRINLLLMRMHVRDALSILQANLDNHLAGGKSEMQFANTTLSSERNGPY